VQVARVVGDVVATRKDPSLTSLKLLLLQPVDEQRRPVGRTLVGCRRGRRRARASSCSSSAAGKARFRSIPSKPPVDAAVVGIVDHWSAEGAEGR
jgi:ethanolamine utilization protein EutN